MKSLLKYRQKFSALLIPTAMYAEIKQVRLGVARENLSFGTLTITTSMI
jgi:hypothetical protein